MKINPKISEKYSIIKVKSNGGIIMYYRYLRCEKCSELYSDDSFEENEDGFIDPEYCICPECGHEGAYDETEMMND